MRDFQHTATGDIELTSGDIVMIDATLQHQRDILLTVPGALKDSPDRGVGAETYFNDESPEDMLRRYRQELIADGMNVKQISMSATGAMTVNAYYEADYQR